MGTNIRTRSRMVMIGFVVILMASVVFIIGTSLEAEQKTADLTALSRSSAPSMPVDSDVFEIASQSRTYLEMTPAEDAQE